MKKTRSNRKVRIPTKLKINRISWQIVNRDLNILLKTGLLIFSPCCSDWIDISVKGDLSLFVFGGSSEIVVVWLDDESRPSEPFDDTEIGKISKTLLCG